MVNQDKIVRMTGEIIHPIRTFREFWPYYFSQHSRPATRWVHCFATVVGVTLFWAALRYQAWTLLLAGVILGYGIAWLSHFLVEKNRPATWKYPVWSFMADLKLAALMLTGKLR
jgi:hypothetical protein